MAVSVQSLLEVLQALACLWESPSRSDGEQNQKTDCEVKHKVM